VLETAITTLHQTTGLCARVLPEIAGQNGVGDAIIEVETDRHKYRFAAEVKTVDSLRDARDGECAFEGFAYASFAGRAIILHGKLPSAAAISICHLSTRQGNAFLEGPGLLIFVVGQPRPAELRQDRFRALKPCRTTHYVRPCSAARN